MMTKVVYVTFFDQLTDKDIIMPFLAKTTKVIGFSSRVIIKYKYSSHKEAYVYEIKEEENLSYPYIDEIVDDFPLLEDKKEDIEKTAEYYFCSVYKILERLLPFPKKEEEYRKVFYVPCSPTPLNKINKRERNVLYSRYIYGKTQLEIAADLGVSQAQVSRIEKSAINNMKKYLK